MICISPVGPEQPESARQLLTNINSRMEFEIAEHDFTCSRADTDELVAWVCVADGPQRRSVERAVKRSGDLELLSVGYFAAADRDLFLLGPDTFQD